VSDVSAPVYPNGAWPLLRFVSVAQKNKPLTMWTFTVQSIDFPWSGWPDKTIERLLNTCPEI